MITITYKDKTYKMQEPFPWFEGTIDVWLENGTLEEVKENKDSILEKLREELDMQMKWYQMEVDLKKNTVESREYQGLQLGKKYGLEFAINLLTSLETKKCDHVSDGVVYTSNPPQYKCSKCGVYSTEFMPIETKEEPQIKISGTFVYEPYNMEAPNYEKFNQKLNGKEWTPTPGEMIEVSMDNNHWQTAQLFKVTDLGQFVVHHHIQSGLHELFPYARPLPQEDIELPGVPDWKAFSPDGDTYDSKDYQIEQLTKFCRAIAPIVNQLIKSNKNPL